jgi:dephospho-CoA kinase
MYKYVKSSNKPTKAIRTLGKRNYLIEGVSGTGKTSVCHELRRRGYAALNSDRDLRQHTDPTTGERLITFSSPEIRHASNLWDVEKVRRLAANQDDEVTFFCGGSRNFNEFIDVFDKVFVLDVDVDTLNERLDNRPDDDWGKSRSERELILRLHATKEDIPKNGIVIDATQPLVSVVDEILSHVRGESPLPPQAANACR